MKTLPTSTPLAVALLMAAAYAAPAAATPTDPILYVADSGGRLGTVNLNTFDVDVIGPMGVTLYDIAFSPTGELYGVSPDGLYEVNPETGAANAIGAGAGFAGSTMNALVFATDGTLYAAGTNRGFYTVDTTSGGATFVGDMGYASAGDLVFGQSGALYLASASNTLVEVDRVSGAGTEVGPMGFSEVYGLARDANNVTYGYSGSDLFTIDLATGEGAALFDYGGSGLAAAFGGSFREEALGVPEPTAVVTAVLAGLVIVSGCRR